MIQQLKKLIKAPRVEVELTPGCQSHVLKYRMIEKEMTHDEKSIVDLHNVRLVADKSLLGNTFELFFCPLNEITVVDRIQQGDGDALPERAELKRIKGPRKKWFGRVGGLYCLKNVVLHSNGSLSIESTPTTEWVAVKDYE